MRRQFIIVLACCCGISAASAKNYTLKNDKVQIAIDERGRLKSLKNLTTGRDYAGDGYLWRLYYERKGFKENEIAAGMQSSPEIEQKGNSLILTYPQVTHADTTVNVSLKLTVTLEPEMVRFSSEITNNQPHTIVRELHYPLIQDMRLPEDYKLFLPHTGGQVYDNPKELIEKHSMAKPYATPAQRFRQMPAAYPTRATTAGCSGNMASNCFDGGTTPRGCISVLTIPNSRIRDTACVSILMAIKNSPGLKQVSRNFHMYSAGKHG